MLKLLAQQVQSVPKKSQEVVRIDLSFGQTFSIVCSKAEAKTLSQYIPYH
jgi:hypothetical protein